MLCFLFYFFFFFFFNDTATTEIYTLSLHDALPIRFHHALDSALVERDVLLRRNRHERVRRKGYRVNTRLLFPLSPAVVVLCCSQAKRFHGRGLRKNLVSQFAREKSRQHRVIRLADNYKFIALILDNHCAALFRSRIVRAPSWVRRTSQAGRLAGQ